MTSQRSARVAGGIIGSYGAGSSPSSSMSTGPKQLGAFGGGLERPQGRRSCGVSPYARTKARQTATDRRDAPPEVARAFQEWSSLHVRHSLGLA
jgi:hypothetical protein